MGFFVCLFVLVTLCCPRLGAAATRLGLIVTQEELTIWRQRMTDNVGTINGFTYQSIYQNRFVVEADMFKNQSHPGGDGWWDGHTGAGCTPGDGSVVPWGSQYQRGRGAFMVRAAFVFLLTGDTSYAAPVRTELLSQIAQPGTDWTNTSKWCYQVVTGINMFETIPWLMRLLLAYDYLIAGGYTGFSASEQTAIRTWFHNAALFWDQNLVWAFANNPSIAYPGVFDTPQDLTCPTCPGDPYSTAWYQGPTIYYTTESSFYNQPSSYMPFAMGVGIMVNDTTLINHAAAYFTAFIKAGTHDTGANVDFDRWSDCGPPCPGSMWGHAAAIMGALIQTADVYARTGNTSLYALSAPTQWVGGSGSTVSLRTAMQLWAAMANKTVLYYGAFSAGDVNPNTLLTWDSDAIPPWLPDNLGNYYDFSAMAANLYYQDSAVTTAMTRTARGGNANLDGGCNDSQMGGCFTGLWGWWPDLPFMYGNLEGVVNPYDTAGTSPPTITITAPTADPTYTTTVSPLTTLAGQASDADGTITGVSWQCTPGCGSGAANISALPTWTIPSVSLLPGTNNITVIATDNAGQTAQDTLAVLFPTTALTVYRLIR